MNIKYHMDDKGNANECHASQQACPVGGDHFATKAEAQYAYESKNAGKLLAGVQPSKKRSKRFKFAAKAIFVGGAGLAILTTSACNQQIDQPNTLTEAQVQEVQAELYAQYDGDLPPDVQKQLTAWAENNNADLAAPEDVPEAAEKAPMQELPDLPNIQLPDMPSLPDIGLENPSNGPADTSGVFFQGKSLTVSVAEVTEARNRLDGITVAAENPNAENTYDREGDYGSFRSGLVGEIEHRDVTNGTFGNTNTSRATGGSFIDPYTGETIVIGEDKTNVDHVVALSEVESSIQPGQNFSVLQKKAIANDASNLQIVGESINKSKSDKDAGEWLPSYAPSQCRFAVSVINIKSRYNLSVDNAEHAALQNVLNTKC